MASRFRQFWRSDNGSATIEFVILFPVIVTLILVIIFASMLISSLSDLQALAHILARAALRYQNLTSADELCLMLTQTELPSALERLVTSLDAAKITLSCEMLQNSPLLGITQSEVSVRYNMAGDAFAEFAQGLGITLGQVERTGSSFY